MLKRAAAKARNRADSPSTKMRLNSKLPSSGIARAFISAAVQYRETSPIAPLASGS